MCSGGQLCSGSGRPPSSSARDNAQNSGSQYALCALGVGLVALGVIMIVWTVVPSNAPGNNSSSGGGGGGGSKPGQGNMGTKGNTASVAFVLAGVGVAMLLMSICLGMRSKRRQLQAAQDGEARLSARAAEGQERETEETAARYDVPTYEEAVGSGQYPPPMPSQLPSSNSASQLPSYEDLVHGLRHENEGSASAAGPLPPGPLPNPAGAAPTPAQPQPAAAAAAAVAAPPGRQNGLGRKLRPPKVRRIKSEKLRLNNISNAPQAGPLSIEPLTPPPQYDDPLARL